MDREALLHFKSVCETEFGYLVNEYGFKPEPNPQGEFINEYQCRFTDGYLSVVIEGVSHGMDADVSLKDPNGRFVGVKNLAPDFVPLKHVKRKNRNLLSQDEQIRVAAVQLREYGQDILNKNYERFIVLGDRNLRLMQKNHGWSHKQALQ